MIYQSSQAFSLSDGIYPFINSYKAISDLITDMIGYRESMNRIKNQILQGKNLNVGAREFNNILTTRFKNFVGTGLQS